MQNTTKMEKEFFSKIQMGLSNDFIRINKSFVPNRVSNKLNRFYKEDDSIWFARLKINDGNKIYYFGKDITNKDNVFPDLILKFNIDSHKSSIKFNENKFLILIKNSDNQYMINLNKSLKNISKQLSIVSNDKLKEKGIYYLIFDEINSNFLEYMKKILDLINFELILENNFISINRDALVSNLFMDEDLMENFSKDDENLSIGKIVNEDGIKNQLHTVPIKQIQYYEDDDVEIDVKGRIISIDENNDLQNNYSNTGGARSAVFADETGKLNLFFYNQKDEENFVVGEPYIIENARTRLNMYSVDLNVYNNTKTIKLSEKRASELFIPDKVTIENVIYNYKKIGDFDENDEDILIIGRIIDLNKMVVVNRSGGVIEHVRIIEIADETGSIRVELRNNNAKRDLKIGQPLKLLNPTLYVEKNNSFQSIEFNRTSILEISENEIEKLPSHEELIELLLDSKPTEDINDNFNDSLSHDEEITENPDLIINKKINIKNHDENFNFNLTILKQNIMILKVINFLNTLSFQPELSNNIIDHLFKIDENKNYYLNDVFSKFNISFEEKIKLITDVLTDNQDFKQTDSSVSFKKFKNLMVNKFNDFYFNIQKPNDYMEYNEVFDDEISNYSFIGFELSKDNEIISDSPNSPNNENKIEYIDEIVLNDSQEEIFDNFLKLKETPKFKFYLIPSYDISEENLIVILNNIKKDLLNNKLNEVNSYEDTFEYYIKEFVSNNNSNSVKRYYENYIKSLEFQELLGEYITLTNDDVEDIKNKIIIDIESNNLSESDISSRFIKYFINKQNEIEYLSILESKYDNILEFDKRGLFVSEIYEIFVQIQKKIENWHNDFSIFEDDVETQILKLVTEKENQIRSEARRKFESLFPNKNAIKKVLKLKILKENEYLELNRYIYKNINSLKIRSNDISESLIINYYDSYVG